MLCKQMPESSVHMAHCERTEELHRRSAYFQIQRAFAVSPVDMKIGTPVETDVIAATRAKPVQPPTSFVHRRRAIEDVSRRATQLIP